MQFLTVLAVIGLLDRDGEDDLSTMCCRDGVSFIVVVLLLN